MTNPFAKAVTEGDAKASDADIKAVDELVVDAANKANDAVGDILKTASASAAGFSTGMTGAVAVGTQVAVKVKNAQLPKEGIKSHSVGTLAGLRPTITYEGIHYWSREDLEAADDKSKARAEDLLKVGRASAI